MKIEDVIQQQGRRLMAIPGVTGIGQGESGGRQVIIIMVKELTPELKAKLPKQLDGFAVRVDVIGEVNAL